MLPAAVKDVLYKHLRDVKRLHEEDLRKGFGRVALPYALDRKISERGQRMGMAVGVSGDQSLHRSGDRRKTPTSPA
jgi:hypothetical protein